MNARIAIIVPVFNRPEPIKQLLAQLKKQSFTNFHVYVVDHGTKKIDCDPSETGLTILQRSEELWFTAAVNEGLKEALNSTDFSHVAILNDDIILSSHHWLKYMLEFLPENSICSSAAVDENQKIIYAGLKFRAFKFRYLHVHRGDPVGRLPNDLHPSDVLPTRGILFPHKALKEVGLLDADNFPQYASDYEWTARAKKRGYSLFVNSHVHVQTQLNDLSSRVSGRNHYAAPRWKNFLVDSRSLYKQGSLKICRRYANKVFNNPYNLLYFYYHAGRKFLAFFFTNYLSPSK